MWGARLGVPLVFGCIKEALSGLMGGSRWSIIKKKLDWYPHHQQFLRFKKKFLNQYSVCLVVFGSVW